MNPLLRPLNLIVIFCLLVFGALYYHTGKQEERYRETALPWLEGAMADISSWRSERMWNLLAPEARQAISREQLDNLLERYARLGRFEAFEEVRFSRLMAALSLFSPEDHVSYSASAKFANGTAVVQATLLDSDGHFAIYNFNIQ